MFYVGLYGVIQATSEKKLVIFGSMYMLILLLPFQLKIQPKYLLLAKCLRNWKKLYVFTIGKGPGIKSGYLG